MTAAETAAGAAVAREPRWLLWAERGGFAVWAIFLAAVVVLIAIDPGEGTVTSVYRAAALGWWRGEDVWGTGAAGFLYLPSFAVVFTPFALLGPRVGDIAWCLVSVGLLSAGLWQLYRRLIGPVPPARLGATLLISFPAAAAAIRDGQATPAMLALMLLATAALADGRRLATGLWLAAAIALKPLALVMAMLMAALYPRTILPLALGLLVVLAAPLIHPNPETAMALYRAAFDKILTASAPGPGPWADLSGLLGALGWSLSGNVMTVIRVAAALATLALALQMRRESETEAALGLLTLGNVYLMLFSPRTEINTYIMLVIPVALYAALLWHRERAHAAAWGLTAISLGLGTQAYGTAIFRATELWLKPLLALVFLAVFLLPRWLGTRSHLSASSSGKP
jgi:hypothetical protein